MNKITAILIAMFSVFLIPKAFAQKKMTYGVGVDIFQTKLNNVDRENFSGYGHSVPGFTQNNQLGFGATFLVQTPIYKNLSFETGLGITNFNSQFHFKYIRQNTNDSVNTKLNISLFYAKAPLYLTYNLSLNKRSAISFSLGTDIRFLFLGDDNFQEIIYELINLGNPRLYKILIFSPQISLGYSFKLKNNATIQLKGTGGLDLGKAMRPNNMIQGWGFYNNLFASHYTYYGLSLKYFFTK